MSSSLLPVKSGDAVMLYNITQAKFLATPVLQVVSTGSQSQVTATPVLTEHASEAGLYIIGFAPHESQPLCLSDSFLLRSATTAVGNRVYVGVDRSDPLTGTSSLGFGQNVLCLDAQDLRTVLWTAKGDAQFGQTLWFGVPYALYNVFYQTHLQVNPVNYVRLSAALDSPGGIMDHWVFVPTEPLFVCQRAVEMCATSRGSENAYHAFICHPNEHCYNRYHEPVYFTQQKCDSQCGIIDPTADETQ